MNDSLVAYQPGSSETREESLSRQFYEWERRGRGWEVFDFPVELEPPFRPFFLLGIPNIKVTDDGRKPTFFSNLLEGLRRSPPQAPALQNNQLAEYQSYLEETNEPDYCRYTGDEFTELRLVLPKDQKVTKSVAEHLLLSFSYATNPVGFEIIGSGDQIVVQFAATEADASQVKQQINSHLPNSSLIETTDYLSGTWINGGSRAVIADFGLSNEFMLPLRAASDFDTDLLVSVIGAISNLGNDEIGIFQVLFQKTKYGWAEEMIDSVRFFDGTPFFVNAPEMIPLAKEKIRSPLFAAVVRAAARSRHKERTWQIVRNLGAGLASLSNPVGNNLIPLSNDRYDFDYHEQGLLNRTSYRCGMILNSEELVSIVHPPSANVRTEKLVRESEKTKAVPGLTLNHSLILGENHHEGATRWATLSNEQRTKHIHVIGSSGSGKSTLLLNLIKQDLNNNQGLCVIDPHGDLVDEIIANMPESRIKDVILFDPSDAEFPIGFNILRANSEPEKTLLSSDLIATFRRMSTSWGDVMDSVLANAILAFIESSRGGTLFDLKRFLVEKDFRADFLETVEDDAIRYFWLNEFSLISGKPQSSILIRLDSFLRQKLIRNIVCQKESRLDFRAIMDGRKILLIKLAQGAIGEENAYLLGTLLVSKIYQMALSRQDSSSRPHFWLYLDEFHHFVTPSMESVLSGARKYNLGLVLAHQEFRQLQSRSQEVASSVLSNCYTRICFRLGDTDAERFANGFSFFDADSLQNLSVGEAVARVERTEFDFNLQTSLLPKAEKEISHRRRAEIVRMTREQFATPKAEVEAEIKARRPAETTISSPGKAKEAEDKIKDTESREISTVKIPKATEKTKLVHPEKPIPQIKEEDFNPTPTTSPPRTEKTVSGTQQHRYLQSLVKRMAENKGFLVTLEKQIFGGIGRIDVALENETRKIACEISVTNEADYEIQNIQKCLSAGYNPAILISGDRRHLEKIRQKAKENLPEKELESVLFFAPEEFYVWLENLETETSSTEEKVKGFRVKVKLKPLEEASQGTRKRAISDVVFGALKKLKKGAEDK
ncbi:MAG: type IV secretion system DNA-binding domain-containing protein [Acidobacteria bacterium]|nr:type IV secretion system DNA-binding domain-containing protein [Acidobacteriota bacterium]MCA1637093.1 type IV secretion system DNA-binding domain-containing protein [Acidobacteriota bacterium]